MDEVSALDVVAMWEGGWRQIAEEVELKLNWGWIWFQLHEVDWACCQHYYNNPFSVEARDGAGVSFVAMLNKHCSYCYISSGWRVSFESKSTFTYLELFPAQIFPLRQDPGKLIFSSSTNKNPDLWHTFNLSMFWSSLFVVCPAC